MDSFAGYSEATERVRVSEVPLSHVSIEAGHFYMDDFGNGDERLRAQFQRIGPLVQAFTAAARAEFGPQARVSTCFLIDDYFRHDTDPTEVINRLLGIADEYGVVIDYLAREAGCWEVPATIEGADAIGLAEIVAARIVAEPPREFTGRRPPVTESGWLCNGRRSSEDEPSEAMRFEPYRPSEELAAREHSIFLDVQIWSRRTVRVNGRNEIHTKWSCPFLASIWQLLRLGMLRYEGRPVVEPRLWTSRSFPAKWWEMPAVIQLNPSAKPFAAYRSLSLLPQRYLGVEHAVRIILEHIDLDAEVIDQIVARAGREEITLPRTVTKRLSHLLLEGS